MPKISDEKRAARRTQILEAAWTCFQKEGLHATTMDDIIRASRLSAGAVYSYFPSKDELILAAVTTSLSGLTALVEPLLRAEPAPTPAALLLDIAATIDHVRGLAEVNGKVGAVGFCLGGLLAFLTATRTDSDASVAYYGVGIEKNLVESEKQAHPLLMHIAEEDQFVPKEAQALILAQLKNHPQVEIFTYPGRDHAFARQGGEHYDAADAKLAGDRTLAFFQQHLA